MSLPLKIALATLGSGVVAVGGHEIFSAATGKPGWIISSSKSENSAPTDQPQSQQDPTHQPASDDVVTDDSNIEEIQKKIDDLVTSDTFKCEVKVKNTPSDPENPWKEAVTKKSELEKLFAKLESIKEDSCGTYVTTIPKKKLILYKETQGQQIVFKTDKEKVDSWVEEKDNFKNGKCSLEIFVSSVNKSINDWDDISGLFEFLNQKKVEESCASTTKTIIVQKIGNTWFIYSDEEQKIDSLIRNKGDGCVVKVKRKEPSSEEQDWRFVREPESLKGISNALENISSSDCSSDKPIVLLEGESNTWTQKTNGVNAEG